MKKIKKEEMEEIKGIFEASLISFHKRHGGDKVITQILPIVDTNGGSVEFSIYERKKSTDPLIESTPKLIDRCNFEDYIYKVGNIPKWVARLTNGIAKAAKQFGFDASNIKADGEKAIYDLFQEKELKSATLFYGNGKMVCIVTKNDGEQEAFDAMELMNAFLAENETAV